uniref:Genome polyprotein n=4 Tax=Jutiapa virus TaxID=64299 RepID=A0A0C4W3V9_9FLAV|nr:polyprotein [Jutiapa virus]AJA91182.1 polyprotein [Jutiapa virus]
MLNNSKLKKPSGGGQRASGRRKKPSSQPVPMNLVMGVVHYATHIALGMKVNSRLRKFWRATPVGKLARVLTTLMNILRSLLNSVSQRKAKKQRGGQVVCVFPLVLVLVLGMEVVRDGGNWILKPSQHDTGAVVSVGNGTCAFSSLDVGFPCEHTVTYDCVTLVTAEEPVGVDCYCRGVDQVRVTYPLCRQARIRERRSLPIAKHPEIVMLSSTGFIPTLKDVNDHVGRAEEWVTNNYLKTIALGVVVVALMGFSWQSILVALLLVLVAPAISTGCVGVQEREILKGAEGTTWFEVLLEKKGCVTITAVDKPSIDIWLDDVKQSSVMASKEFCMKVEVSETQVSARCPTQGDATLGVEGKDDYVCKRTFSDRGWGNGCGLFGKGSIIGCAKTTCKDSNIIKTKVYETQSVQYVVAIEVHRGEVIRNNVSEKVVRATFSAEAEKHTVEIQDYGSLDFTCRVVASADLSNIRLIEVDSHYFNVHEDWLDDLPLPWRINEGRWKNMDRLVNFREPYAVKMIIMGYGDQRPAVLGALDKAEEIKKSGDAYHLNGGHVSCRVSVQKLKMKGTSYQFCTGNFEWTKKPILTNHDTVVLEVKYLGSDAPCRIPFKNTKDGSDDRGVLITSNPYVERTSGQVFLELEPLYGVSTIKVGDLSYQWNQKGSAIGKAVRKITNDVHKTLVIGSAFWNSDQRISSLNLMDLLRMPFSFLFGNMSFLMKIILSCVMIWFCLNVSNITLSVVAGVLGFGLLAFTTGVMGDHGCILDIERQEMKCGDGVMVWNEVNDWFSGYHFYPDDPETFVASLVHDKSRHCGYNPTNAMELAMWQQLQTQLNYLLESQNLEWRVVVASDYDGFPSGGNVGWKRKTGRNGLSWTNWLKSFDAYEWIFENAKGNGSYYVGKVGMSECPSSQRSWNAFSLTEFGVGMLTTRAFLDITTGPDRYCDTGLIGTAAKDNYMVHGSTWMWMESYAVNGTLQLQKLTYLYFVECLWPMTHTLDGKGVLESELILPRDLGGPISNLNRVKGYAVQDKGPWREGEITLERGYCPDTTVVVEEECAARGPSVKSTTEGGINIKDWCCKHCTLPPLKYTVGDDCWYAMEIRPRSKVNGLVMACDGEVVFDWGVASFLTFLYILTMRSRAGRHLSILCPLVGAFAYGTGLMNFTSVVRYLLALSLSMMQKFPEPVMWEIMMEVVFNLRPAGLLGMIFSRAWNFERMCAMVVFSRLIQDMVSSRFLYCSYLDAGALVFMGSCLGMPRLAHFLTVIVLNHDWLGGDLVRQVSLGFGALTLIAMSREFTKETWIQKTHTVVTLGLITLKAPFGFLVALWPWRRSIRTTDVTAIVGIILALGASVARNGINSELWVIGVLGAFLACFMIQVTVGGIHAEWDSHLDWKERCSNSTATIDLAVRRLPDGRLVNLSEKEGSHVDSFILAVGMILTGFHWVGLPLTIGGLAVKRWLVRPREQRSLIVYGGSDPENMEETGTVEDGVYRIFSSSLMGKKQIGVGVMQEGVFHTMWHVTRGSAIKVNGRLIVPHWASVEEDLISYSGTWRLSRKWQGDEVQVHAYTPDGNVQCTQLLPSKMELEDGTNLGLLPLDFPPGSSGSPIIDVTGAVIGLYGNGVLHGDIYCSSIAQTQKDIVLDQPALVKTDGWMSKGKLTVIDAHPGSGKTHKILPDLIKRALDRRLRTLVLAPTRVVVKEMEAALRGMDVSFHSSAASKKCAGSLADVMCHATFVTRKLIHMPQKNYEVIIMDEAHWTDPSSIAARGFITSLCEAKKCAVVLMTATPPGVEDPWPESNAPINDEEKVIPETAWKQGYEWISDYEGRTAWFVPSQNAGNGIAKTLRGLGKKVIILTSKTFHDAYPKIKEEKPDFVLTTDISEMGANLDVDRVIDPRTTLKPTEKGDVVEVSGERKITPASAAQRRGRVGRIVGRKADYVYQGDVNPDDSELVCWKEAQMLLDNMESRSGQASVFYGPEQSKMTEMPGFFKLRDEARKTFRHLLTACDFTPWLAWKVANEGKSIENRKWLSAGPKEHLVTDENCDPVTYKTPGGRVERLQPIWLDNRMVRERKDLQALIDYGEMRRSVVMELPSVFVAQMMEALDNVYSYYTAKPGSRHFQMAEKALPTSLLSILQGFLMLFGLMVVIVWLCSSRKIDRVFLGTLVILGCSVAAYMGGVQLAMVASAALIAFILLICMVPEEGMQRTQIDTTLAIFVHSMLLFVGMVVANEMRWLENTKKDLKDLFAFQESVEHHGPILESLAASLDIKPMTIWGVYATLVTFLRPQLLHGLKMFTHRVIAGAVSGKTDTILGLRNGFVSAGMGLADVSLLVSFCRNLNPFTLVLGMVAAMLHWAWFYPMHEASLTSKAHRVVTQSMARNNLLEGEIIANLDEYAVDTDETERKTSFVVACSLGIINALVVRSPWAVCEASLIILSAIRYFLDPRTMTMLTLPVVSGMGAIIRGDYFGVAPILHAIYLSAKSQRRGIVTSNPTYGEMWKKALNAMTQKEFIDYKRRMVTEVDRADAREAIKKGKTNTGHSVSRGTSKLCWMDEHGLISLEGTVVDLGCGRGGWSYYAAAQPSVREVKSFTLGTSGHEKPILMETFGWNLISFKSKVDVFSLEPFPADTIMCDIGESNPNSHVESKRTLQVLKLLKEWKKKNPHAGFVVKVLNPYSAGVMEELLKMQAQFGGGIVRLPMSRNSTHEMYYTSSITNNIVGNVTAVTKQLMRRMQMEGGPRVIPDVTLPLGTRNVEYKCQKCDQNKIADRIHKLKSENSDRWIQDNNHPYRTWTYHGSFKVRSMGTKASAPNHIVRLLSWPWNQLERVVSMSMTDTTAFGQQRVFKEKVDTKAPEPPKEVRRVMRLVFTWLVKRILAKGGKVRLCTKEEFINKIESHAAIGAWSKEMESWTSAREAVNDPMFWNLVSRERELHKKGKCEMCVYNLMGKREKKPGEYGVAKGSRTIWYMWLGSRFLEFEAFGFLNEEHWASRKLSGGGVEGVPLAYLGYLLSEMADKPGVLYADDTAGWDTRITEADLEDERTLLDYMTPEHRLLAQPLFDLTYMNKVALCPRPYKTGGVVIDVISRRDQRGSGQVVTYALNTLTNIKVQLIRMAESEGVLTSELQDNGLRGWLEMHGEDRLTRLLVSGDDCVVNAMDERFSNALTWLNLMAKVRKDVGQWEPSRGRDDWEEVEFCSNHFHRLTMKDGRELIVPCRDQTELVARACVNQGGSADPRATGCLAKSYAQMWQLLYFHRRDLRMMSLAIMSAVPVDWVPTGRTTWSVHAGKEWMTDEDMLEVWNRIWIRDNPWMDRKDEIDQWSNIPYLPRKVDKKCGSLIGMKNRIEWAKLLPGAVLKVRNVFGRENFRDYLQVMGRFVQKQPSATFSMY